MRYIFLRSFIPYLNFEFTICFTSQLYTLRSYITLRIANLLNMDTLVRTIHLGLKFRGKVGLKHLVTLWCLLSCFLRYNIRFAYQAQQFKGNLKATHFIGWSIHLQFAIICDGFYVIYKLTPAINALFRSLCFYEVVYLRKCLFYLVRRILWWNLNRESITASRDIILLNCVSCIENSFAEWWWM